MTQSTQRVLNESPEGCELSGALCSKIAQAAVLGGVLRERDVVESKKIREYSMLRYRSRQYPRQPFVITGHPL